MGMLLGKTMDDNLKKQQEFMLKTQQLQMERQIQMQNQMRERQMAMMLARSRDLFMWFSSFYGVATLGLLAGFSRTKSRGMIAPIIPLSFILAYQWDLAYGSKMNRMRDEADRIMDNEGVLLELPHDLPNMATIEAARLKQKDKDRVAHGHDIFL